MALFVSCILTMHMMLYFFHHFELPFVLNTFQIRMRINNENVRIATHAPASATTTATSANASTAPANQESDAEAADDNVDETGRVFHFFNEF